jgi:hypothetical protein
MVTVDVTGMGPVTYNDTGHVLDTNGYDFAYNGSNESFQWRLIGTSGTPGVPEPSTWAMMLLGFAGIGFAGYRKAKSGHGTFRRLTINRYQLWRDRREAVFLFAEAERKDGVCGRGSQRRLVASVRAIQFRA